MRIKYILALLAPVAALAGCGGSGIVNPFFGNYPPEPWTQISPSDTGTITLNVSAIGTVSGSLFDTGASMSYSVSGLIDENGNFTGTITPTAGSASAVSGTLTLNGSNQLVGTVVDTGGTLNTLLVN
ncbi:MAG TPA: hypothetical protein VMI31_16345 [Fimbriimonadaceae bacterium]|nr:hypothetical protein [Fimbriimonadaceae bacterium]